MAHNVFDINKRKITIKTKAQLAKCLHYDQVYESFYVRGFCRDCGCTMYKGRRVITLEEAKTMACPFPECEPDF